MARSLGRGRYLYGTYPEANRGGGSATAFARNFATGPASIVTIDKEPGTQIPWSAIDAGPSSGVNVQITPRSTGIVRISGTVSLKSGSEISEKVQLQVYIDDVLQPLPFNEIASIDVSGNVTMSFDAETDPSVTPIGVATNIQIALFATNPGVISISSLSSSIDVQEVPAATG